MLLPKDFEEVQSYGNVPDGFEVLDEPKRGILAQAGLDVGNVLKYNAAKAGALVNAGLANVNEAVGVESSLFRDNQEFYQDAAKNADEGLNRTYGEDGFIKTVVKEAGNPINYVGGAGLKPLAAAVATDTAAEIATKGDRSGVTLADASKVADNTSIGLVGGKIFDSVVNNINPRKALLGDDIRTPEEISDIKALAKKHGIELTPASTTGSANLARVEHSINDGVAGGLGMRQALNTEKHATDNAIINRLEKMGANGSNTIAGENLRVAADSVINQEKQYFHDAFSNLFAKYGSKPMFSIRGVKQEAQKLVDQAETIPLIKNSTAYRDSKALLESADDLSWSDWSKLRTHLGGLTQDATVTGKASTGAYKNMYSKLEGDLQSSIKTTGDFETFNNYMKVLDDYKKYKQDFEGKDSSGQFVRGVVDGKIKPEAVGSMINNSTLKAKGALAAGGVDAKSGLPIAKKSAATDLLQASMSKTEDGLWLPSFLKYSDREGFKHIANSPNAKEILEPKTPLEKIAGATDDVVPIRRTKPVPTDDAQAIEELQEIAKSVVRKDRLKNTSKTAQYNMINGLKFMSLFDAAKYVLKDGLISMAYRSDIFKKWVESGILSPKQYEILMSISSKEAKNAIKATGANSLLGQNND